MTKPQYLCDALPDKKDALAQHFTKFALNIIEAPCGCGKTEFALRRLPILASSRSKMLMLIDTTFGKKRILQERGTTAYSRMWRDVQLNEDFIHFAQSDGEINVMTYYAFGKLLERDAEFIHKLEVIACDEFHNAFGFREFADDKGAYNNAIANIKFLSRVGECFVVALTATPGRIIKPRVGICSDYQFVKPDAPLRAYTTAHSQGYKNIGNALMRIAPTDNCIIYTHHISDIKWMLKNLQGRGVACEGIWSQRNTEHPMNEEQILLLDHILEKECLPEHINTLIINASCGTGININGEFNKIITNTYNEDEIIQARGRYRGNLDLLYYPDKSVIDEEDLKDYLDEWLEDEKRQELCQKLDLRDSSRHLAKFPTVQGTLEKMGYTVKRKKNGVWRYRITKPDLIA